MWCTLFHVNEGFLNYMLIWIYFITSQFHKVSVWLVYNKLNQDFLCTCGYFMKLLWTILFPYVVVFFIGHLDSLHYQIVIMSVSTSKLTLFYIYLSVKLNYFCFVTLIGTILRHTFNKAWTWHVNIKTTKNKRIWET